MTIRHIADWAVDEIESVLESLTMFKQCGAGRNSCGLLDISVDKHRFRWERRNVQMTRNAESAKKRRNAKMQKNLCSREKSCG